MKRVKSEENRGRERDIQDVVVPLLFGGIYFPFDFFEGFEFLEGLKIVLNKNFPLRHHRCWPS